MTDGRVSFASTKQDLADGVVLITLAGAPSAQEYEVFLNGMRRFLESYQRRGEVVSLVIDPSALTRFDAAMRQTYGEWRAANMDLISKSCARAAYITESAMWRGIMTAVFWVARPVIPVQTFADRPAAIAWIESQGE